MKKTLFLVISVLFINFLDSNDFNIEKHIMREFYNNNPIDLKNLNKTRQIIKQTFAKKLPKNAPLPQTVYKDKEDGFWGDVLEGQFTLIGLLSVAYEPYEQETFSFLFIPDNRNLFRNSNSAFAKPVVIGSIILTSNNYKNFDLNNIANILPAYKEIFKNASCATMPAIITIDSIAIQSYADDIRNTPNALATLLSDDEAIARLLSIQEIPSIKSLQYNVGGMLMDYKDSCFQPYLEYVRTASNDMYVNVRQEPKVNSKVIAKVIAEFPKDYDEKKWEYNIDDEEGNMYVPSKYFYKIQQDFLETHPEVIDIQDSNRIYYIGLPINGWHNVYFTDKNGKKIKGYIHESQLYLGF